ncbi:hypothetical protein GS921_16285 [Rhodococcus hoagii]|nr:hypothetical protein [Prescottella equi]
MTQHIIGALDGVIVTISDSRTTYRRKIQEADPEPPKDTVVKYATYPVDPDDWLDGNLAAVVLLMGRSSFTHEDDHGKQTPGTRPRETADVITEYLSTRSGRYSSLQDLGDGIWQHIMGTYWYGCASCRRACDGGSSLEPTCDDHDEFSLFAAGVNAEEPGPQLYQRKLDRGSGRGTVDVIAWPYVHTEGHGGWAQPALQQGRRMASEFDGDIDAYWADLVEQFNKHAATAPCVEGVGGSWISTVGGTMQSFVIDPRAGVAKKVVEPIIVAAKCEGTS